MKKTTLRQAAMKLALLALVLLSPFGLRAQTLFSEDFEGGSMPTGWTQDQVTGSASWSVSTGDYSSSTGAGQGTYNAKITADDYTTTTKLITPEIDLSSVSSAVLSFMHVQRSWYGDIDELKVYYRSSSNDSWTLLDGQEYTSAVASWTTEEDIVLPNLSSTYQIAFEFKSHYGYGVGLDNIVILQGASCVKPTGLAAELTPGDGSVATLSWTKGGEEHDWEVEYSTNADFTESITVSDGFTIDDDPIIKVNLAHLTAEVPYYARVRAICGDEDVSIWSSETGISFTPTDAYTITVYDSHNESQNNSYIPMYGNYFDNYTKSEFIIPATELTDMQWGSINSITFYAKEIGTNGNPWNTNQKVFVKEVNSTTLGGSYSGTDGATIVYEGSLTIPTASTDGYTITFSPSYTYSGGNLLIGVYNETKGNYRNVVWYGTKDLTSGVSAYGNNSSSLAGVGYHAQTFLPKTKFIYTPGVAPSCLPPTGLAATEDQPDQSELSWDDNDDVTSWDIYWKLASADEFTLIPNVNENHYTLPDLQPITNYQFKVVAHCSGGDSDPSALFPFRTACGTINVGYTCGFEGPNEGGSYPLPLCWSRPDGTSTSYPCAYSSYAHTGSYSLYFSGNTSTTEQIAVLPEIEGGVNGKQLKFYARNTSSWNDAGISVGYMDDPTDASTFHEVTPISLPASTAYGSDPYEIDFVDIEGNPIYIAIKSTTTTSAYIYIDDIALVTSPSCKSVTAVSRTDITSRGVTISWEDNRNGDVTYRVKNGDEVLGSTEVAGVKTITINNLIPSTTYNTLTVEAYCGGDDYSNGSAVLSFSTKSDACSIEAFDITTATIRRGNATIDPENHTVTMPVYYCTADDLAAADVTFTLSTSATAKMQNPATEEWDIVVNSWSDLRSNLAMGNNTVRVFAEDVNVYQDWTITLQDENCSSPSIPVLDAERIRITATWTMPNPNGSNDFQLVCSETELDNEALEAAQKVPVTGLTHTFENLTRGTQYYIYLRANCGNNVYSSWRSNNVTTKTLDFCDDVTIANGTDVHSNMPFDFYNTDASGSHRAQMIYPESILGDLIGSTLKSITFHDRSGSTKNITNTWYIKIGTTTATSLESGLSSETLTQVYSGGLKVSNGVITFNFTSDYEYNGGNLLVEIASDGGSGNWFGGSSTTYGFYGVDNVGSTYSNQSSSHIAFVPRAEFGYCATIDACPAVTSVEASNIDEENATITWDASTGDYVSGYQVIKSETELDAEALAAYTGTFVYDGNDLTCNLSDLNPYTMYYVYVRANCGAPDNTNSTWYGTSFRTLSACGAVDNLAVEQTGKTTATATWTMTKPDQDMNFNYILSTEANLDDHTLNGMTLDGNGIHALTADLTVAPATTYYLYVQNNCGGDDVSPWVSTSFNTYDAMPAVLNLTVTETTHSAIATTWERNDAEFADETSWQVAAVAHGETPSSWNVVNVMHHTFLGLTPETSYDLYVRPYQANPEAFGTETHLDEVTTTAMPEPCAQLGTDNNSANLLYTSYGNTYSQHIYTAAELTDMGYRAGKITSISFNYTGTSSTYSKTQSVYIGTTTLNAFADCNATDFVSADDMTLVYGPTLNSYSSGWRSYEFSTPFEWDGTSNIVVSLLSNSTASSANGWNAQGTSQGNYLRSICRYRDYSEIDITDLASVNNGKISYTRPNIKFCFEIDPNGCFDVTNVNITGVTAKSANISWMPGNLETSWEYRLTNSDVILENTSLGFTTETPSVSYDNDLLADHDYLFWVRPACSEEWTARFPFATVATCGMPTLLDATNITTTSATLNAEAHETIGTASTFTFRYWKAGDEDNKISVDPQSTGSANIDNLDPNTTYYYEVMVTCTGEDGYSRWSSTPMSFTTDYRNLTLPYSTTFEEGHDTEWRLVNGNLTNAWAIGSGASNTTNGRGLYISNDGGTTNAYSISSNAVTYAYAGFSNFEAAKQYTVNFYWKNRGEGGNYDYIRAWIVPDNGEFDAYSPSSMPYASTNPVNWIAVDGGSHLNDVTTWQSNTAHVTVPTDGAYKLVFMWANDGSYGDNPPAAIDSVVVRESDKYDVTVNVSMDAESNVLGSVTSDPTTLTDLYDNTNVVLTAGEALYGYEFIEWRDNNNQQIGSNPSLQFRLHSDTIITAFYDSVSYTITAEMVAQQETENWGTVSGTSTVKFNLPVTLTATPETGYRFVNWTNSLDEVVSTEAVFTVNAYRDSIFTAHFDTIDYNITVAANPTDGGTVTGAGTYKHFTNATLTASASEGYTFVNWTLNNVEVSTNLTFTINSVSEAADYVANFNVNSYTITYMDGETQLDQQTYYYNATVTAIDAPTKEGYTFNGWNPTLPATMPAQNITVTAQWTINQYTITATANPTEGGTVEGAGTYEYNYGLTMVATPSEGYTFVNWTKGGEEVSTNSSFSITVTENADYVANFAVYYTKYIDANKWYAISTPVHTNGNNEALSSVTNLTNVDVDYDLYLYNENEGKWVKEPSSLAVGKGYIYRRASATTLRFIGDVNTEVETTITNSCEYDADLAGFNLVGNPYNYPANPNDNRVFFKLTPRGTWMVGTDNVDVCEAVLVYTSEDDETVFFEPSSKSAPISMPALSFKVSNDEFEDVAYAMFDNGDALPKVSHLTAEAPMLSIPVNGRRYAVAMLGSDCESFDLVFRGTEGDYSIALDGETDSYTYLHLLDRVTGKDVDLLRQPTYSFKASFGDLASRFVVKLRPDVENVTAGNFAFWNGHGWTIEGEGNLQVFDLLGRKMLNVELGNSNSEINISQFPSTGVYILRLGEKTQKIVVK